MKVRRRGAVALLAVGTLWGLAVAGPTTVASADYRTAVSPCQGTPHSIGMDS